MGELDIKGEPFPDTDGRCTVFTKGGKTRILVTVCPGAEKEHPPAEFEAYSMQAIFQELYSAFRATRG